MKNTDLRIGNLTLHNGKIVKVVGIEEKHINILKNPVQCYFHTVPINGLEPIELTEDVLLKCGFKDKDILYVNGRELTYKYDDERYIVIDKRYIGKGLLLSNKKDYEFRESIYVLLEIKYLHQLQNLYHSLTNKELIYETN